MPDASQSRNANPAAAVRELWSEASGALHSRLCEEETTLDQAISLCRPIFEGRVAPDDIDDCIRVVIDRDFAVRTSTTEPVEMLTMASIRGLSSAEVEFCNRALVTLGVFCQADFQQRTARSTLFLVAAAARMCALFAGLMSLYEQSMDVGVGVLFRSLTDLWLGTEYLALAGDEAVDALVSEHRWKWRIDPQEDPIVCMLYGEHIDAVPAPHGPNLRRMVARIDELASDERRRGLVKSAYEGIFREASHLSAHPSVLGLLDHLHATSDGRVFVSAIQRGDRDRDLAAQVLTAGVLIADVVGKVADLLAGDLPSQRSQQLQKFMSALLSDRLTNAATDAASRDAE